MRDTLSRTLPFRLDPNAYTEIRLTERYTVHVNIIPHVTVHIPFTYLCYGSLLPLTGFTVRDLYIGYHPGANAYATNGMERAEKNLRSSAGGPFQYTLLSRSGLPCSAGIPSII